jgi:hypothetical protein
VDEKAAEPEAKKRRQSARSPPPRSPSFGVSSPDYTPSEFDRSRSLSAPPDYEHLLNEATAFVELAKTKAEEADQKFEQLSAKYYQLKNRVIYLEGELAVYRRFASAGRIEPPVSLPTYRVIVAPPPPPPRRV